MLQRLLLGLNGSEKKRADRENARPRGEYTRANKRETEHSTSIIVNRARENNRAYVRYMYRIPIGRIRGPKEETELSQCRFAIPSVQHRRISMNECLSVIETSANIFMGWIYVRDIKQESLATMMKKWKSEEMKKWRNEEVKKLRNE